MSDKPKWLGHEFRYSDFMAAGACGYYSDGIGYCSAPASAHGPRPVELAAPDANCVSLPDGDCVGIGCMHDAPAPLKDVREALCSECGNVLDSEHCPKGREEERDGWAEESRLQAERAEKAEAENAQLELAHAEQLLSYIDSNKALKTENAALRNKLAELSAASIPRREDA